VEQGLHLEKGYTWNKDRAVVEFDRITATSTTPHHRKLGSESITDLTQVAHRGCRAADLTLVNKSGPSSCIVAQ